MDLGCLDLGCISLSDKNSTDSILDPLNKETDATENVTSATKTGKGKSPKGNGQSTLSALNKFTVQIKKPPHRKNSPLNWFPRKKVDSYLKRKIKMLQEIDGMNLTLDETLCDSNPHYSRVLREKIAAREAAEAAMEARKAALVEASWCKTLRAARIPSKDAEELLLKAEKSAVEAFEAATALGVIMYDKPNCPRKPSEIETSTVNGGRSTTHTVTASFETAFDVDKEVAAAVKTAFARLASCPSFNKDEFKELLLKISQNPDMGDNNNHESSEFSSEYESESGSEVETISQNEGLNAQDKFCKLPTMEPRQRKYKRRQSLEKLNMTKLVDMMLERLRCLKEDELSSLATIVATCGLNAALAEAESRNIPRRMSTAGSAADYSSKINVPRRMSTAGAGTMAYSSLEQMTRKQAGSELPSLDKYLVKHTSKLEREVQEAKNSRRNAEENVKNTDQTNDGGVVLDSHLTCGLNAAIAEAESRNIPRRMSTAGSAADYTSKINVPRRMSTAGAGTMAYSSLEQMTRKQAESELPSLDKYLVKHTSKLEREVQEAKNSRRNAEENVENTDQTNDGGVVLDSHLTSHEAIPDLGSILLKHSCKLEKEIEEAKWLSGKTFNITNKKSLRDPSETIPDLGSILIKHSSKLGKGAQEIRKTSQGKELERTVSNRKKDVSEVPSLDKFLVKHVSRLEKEVQEAKNRRENGNSVSECEKNTTSADQQQVSEKENIDKNVNAAGNKEKEDSLGKIHGLEREKMQALKSRYGNQQLQNKHGGNTTPEYESLDKVLVKHVSRLEKAKMEFNLKEEEVKKEKKTCGRNVVNEEGSLDQILVKHKSRLEREKMASSQEPEEQIRVWGSRREAKRRELQEAWGGISLNSMKPHVSKLERDKAAWIRAEEEERRHAA